MPSPRGQRSAAAAARRDDGAEVGTLLAEEADATRWHFGLRFRVLGLGFRVWFKVTRATRAQLLPGRGGGGGEGSLAPWIQESRADLDHSLIKMGFIHLHY